MYTLLPPFCIRLRFLQPPTVLPSINDDNNDCEEAAVVTSGDNIHAYDSIDCCVTDDAQGGSSSCCTSASDNDHDHEKEEEVKNMFVCMVHLHHRHNSLKRQLDEEISGTK